MTSTPRRTVNFLRLVEPGESPKPLAHSALQRPAWQHTLFAKEHPSLLVFVHFDRIADVDFLTLITGSRPRVVFDLRRVPRFDVGELNRRLVFQLFTQSGVEYVDLSGKVHLAGSSASGDRAALREVTSVLALDKAVRGPIVFLVENQQFENSSIEQLVEGMPPSIEEAWDVLKLPIMEADRARAGQRNLIFISHATPQDNAFAAWLSSQLAIAGYQVWSDVTKLVGGELFWNDIEEAIRLYAAKVVVVLSRASQGKSGVLDETDLSLRVERAQSLSGLVVPVRLDDLPFEQVRANLGRKNIIDFNQSWATGLAALLKVLERDGAPRTLSSGADALTQCLSGRFRAQGSVVHRSEALTSNWLSITQIPDAIELLDIDAPVEEIQAIVDSLDRPSFRFLRLVGVLGGSEALAARASVKYSIPMADFLSGRSPSMPGLSRRDAERYLSDLLRQAWDRTMERLGLRPFETASGSIAWFMPKGLIENDKVSFVDEAGVRRRKQLVGWSDRRQVFWHAAFDAKPSSQGGNHYVIRQHVIFTEDGERPLFSKVRMHALRRSFCRSWWNDRWRDLLVGFVQHLSQSGSLSLQAGGAAAVVSCGNLLRVESKVAPDEYSVNDDEPEATDYLDAIDLDDEWPALDESDQVPLNGPVE